MNGLEKNRKELDQRLQEVLDELNDEFKFNEFAKVLYNKIMRKYTSAKMYIRKLIESGKVIKVRGGWYKKVL